MRTVTVPTDPRNLPPLPGWQIAMTVAIVSALVILLLAATIWFYRSITSGSFMEGILRQWLRDLKPAPDSVTALVDEFVTRRYEFLTFIGQFVIAALVTSVITILLLTQRVAPDAGLPLLATILGIVLGKGVLTRRALPERPTSGTNDAEPKPRPVIVHEAGNGRDTNGGGGVDEPGSQQVDLEATGEPAAEAGGSGSELGDRGGADAGDIGTGGDQSAGEADPDAPGAETSGDPGPPPGKDG